MEKRRLSNTEPPTRRSLGIAPRTLLWSFVLCFLCSASYAVEITVPGNYSTIQEAIDAAVNGDEIIVSPGTYVENINFGGKNIILRSTDPADPGVVANTIIDGNQAGSVVTFSGGETADCVLSGFTITNGYARYGGGIDGNGTHATVENNVIVANSADGHGGGLYRCDGLIRNNTIASNTAESCGGGLSTCDGAVQDNAIAGNSAGYGGGGLSYCKGTIQNNIVSDNSAGNDGGGGLDGCDGIIRSNVISDNTASYGGGLSSCEGVIQNNVISDNTASRRGGGLSGCDGTIQNNTISGNSAGDHGGGLYGCDGDIVNCIVWGNSTAFEGDELYNCSTPIYSCIQDWTEGAEGNISVDPGFVDASTGDYHLLPESPCIDAGSLYYFYRFLTEPVFDVDGDCRLVGSSVDMGSDEYRATLDSDRDLLSDDDEVSYGSSVSDPDTDGDGLRDGVEVLRGTSPTSYDTASGLAVPSDCSSIQEAIFLAFHTEVVTVMPGTYLETIHFHGKDVVLRSTDPTDPHVVANTIIDGNEAGSVVTFSGEESADCVLSGLTITNGYARYRGGIGGYGGGIRGYGTLATIENNTISGNSAEYEGGGLHDCDGLITENTISGNSAKYYGGGLYDCDGTIASNVISGNWTYDTQYWFPYLYYGGGGGLCYCGGSIQNNIISANSSDLHGGGLRGCSGIVQNNTVYGNSANGDGGGLYGCKGDIVNCIIRRNSAGGEGNPLYECSIPSYSCIQGFSIGGTGNIFSADPQLVDPDNGDFHLLPTSPCIDAGGYIDDLARDFEGHPRGYDGTSEPRGDGSDYDMGADEYVPTGDTDGDGLPDWTETNSGVYIDETDTGTDPNNPDTDGDGLADGDEVYDHFTDPNVADTDADGLNDEEEINTYLTDPLDADTDDDGLADGEEVNTYFTDPLDADTDGDGLLDGAEVAQGTDPLDPASGHTRGGSGEPCFIATATYGTPAAPEVDMLQEFRDRYLLTNRFGAFFVRAYYRFSPPVARCIATRELFKSAARAVLTPVVAMAKLVLGLSAAPLMLTGVGLASLAASAFLIAAKRGTNPATQ